MNTYLTAFSFVTLCSAAVLFSVIKELNMTAVLHALYQRMSEWSQRVLAFHHPLRVFAWLLAVMLLVLRPVPAKKDGSLIRKSWELVCDSSLLFLLTLLALRMLPVSWVLVIDKIAIFICDCSFYGLGALLVLYLVDKARQGKKIPMHRSLLAVVVGNAFSNGCLMVVFVALNRPTEMNSMIIMVALSGILLSLVRTAPTAYFSLPQTYEATKDVSLGKKLMIGVLALVAGLFLAAPSLLPMFMFSGLWLKIVCPLAFVAAAVCNTGIYISSFASSVSKVESSGEETKEEVVEEAKGPLTWILHRTVAKPLILISAWVFCYAGIYEMYPVAQSIGFQGSQVQFFLWALPLLFLTMLVVESWYEDFFYNASANLGSLIETQIHLINSSQVASAKQADFLPESVTGRIEDEEINQLASTNDASPFTL